MGTQLSSVQEHRENITIHFAKSNKEKEQIYRFRYQIYVEEMGKKISLADHAHKMLWDNLDTWGILLYARAGMEIIGTIRLHIGMSTDFPPDLANVFCMKKFETFRPSSGKSHNLSFSSKLMVTPRYRSSQTVYLLMTKVYELCREHDVQFLFCGCAPYMIPLYEQVGFRRYTKNFIVPDYGYMVPLVLLTEDIDHLRSIRSFGLRVTKKYQNNPDSAQWFSREFPQASRFVNSQLMNKELVWGLLKNKLRQSPEKAISLLHGLTEEEALACLQAGTILQCKKGDTIVTPRDVGHELFILLSGTLEVRKQEAGSTILKRGQTFGETALIERSRRSASVIARSDCELLVLPSQSFERIKHIYPNTAAKVLRNIVAAMPKVG